MTQMTFMNVTVYPAWMSADGVAAAPAEMSDAG